ncbi:MAG: arylesterase [Gammaproteobacteria bacterium]
MALSVLIIVCLGQGSSAQAQAPAGTPVLLVLGDSLSAAYGIKPEQGWVALLAKRIAQRGFTYRVVNASISGETTRGALARLPALMSRHRPALVVLELGANDGLRGLPIGEFRRNLRALVDLARGGGARVVILPVRLPPNYGEAFNSRFVRVYDEVAAATGASQSGMFLEGVGGRPELIQEDGLHPRAQAQARLLENAWPALEAALRAQAPTD